jgi:hypothetical protein
MARQHLTKLFYFYYVGEKMPYSVGGISPQKSGASVYGAPKPFNR